LFQLSHAFGTAQIGDKLIYKGEQFVINSEPLGSYLDEVHPGPTGIFEFKCTACWRGYVATWKIEEGYLYLVKIAEGTCEKNPPEIPVSRVFPGQKAPFKAEWFSGVIRIPQGKLLEYVHMGYESIYENEIILTFEKGKLVKESVIDNKASGGRGENTELP